MPYIGKTPNFGVRSRFYYTQSSAGGTSVSGSDDNGLTLAFADGLYVDVMLNGVTLVAGTDYNTNTANTIAGLSALSASDIVEVVVYDVFSVADTVPATGGTYTGTIVYNGAVTYNTGLQGNTNTSSGLTLDFDTFQNFFVTLSSGLNTLANPTTEAGNIGQSGFILFTQPSSGSAGTLSVASDYEVPGGGGSISLSSANSAVDLVPYIIKADNSILLGQAQLAFS